MRQHRRQQTGEGLRVKARAFVEGMNERRREGFRTHVVEGARLLLLGATGAVRSVVAYLVINLESPDPQVKFYIKKRWGFTRNIS